MPWSEVLYPWLVHWAAVSFLISAIGSAAVLLCRQPIRRVRIIELTLAGCLIAPCLGMIPGYPQVGIGWHVATGLHPQETGLPSSAKLKLGQAGSPGDQLRQASDFRSRVPPVASVAGPFFLLDFPAWVVTVYGLGVTFGLAWWLVGLAQLARIVRSSRPAPPRCREVLRQVAGRPADRVRLLATRRLRQPFASAWGRPVIILPDALCGDMQTLRWCLTHEWTHIRNHDLQAWLVSGLVRVLLFYQPLVWWLRHQLRLGQDFLADAHAARQTPQPEDYAEFLTTWAAAGSWIPAPAGLGMGLYKSELYRRVVMVVQNPTIDDRTPRLWAMSVALVAMMLVTATAALSVAPLAAAEEKLDISSKPSATQCKPKSSSATEDQSEPSPRHVQFHYRFQHWDDTLGDVARQAGLTLKADDFPPGTFNYSDTRPYTFDEALDLLNNVLLSKGFVLHREGQILRLVRSGEQPKQAAARSEKAAGMPRTQEKQGNAFVPFATLQCDGTSGALGGPVYSTGFTFVKLSNSQADETKLAVSFASDQPADDVMKYRVIAMDKQRRIIVNEAQGVSGRGRRLGVITILCSFPIAEKDLDKLVIERLKD